MLQFLLNCLQQAGTTRPTLSQFSGLKARLYVVQKRQSTDFGALKL